MLVLASGHLGNTLQHPADSCTYTEAQTVPSTVHTLERVQGYGLCREHCAHLDALDIPCR